MANTISQIKRNRTNFKRNKYNSQIKSTCKTYSTKVIRSVDSDDLEQAKHYLRLAFKALDKAQKNGVYKSNNADRKKSKINRYYNDGWNKRSEQTSNPNDDSQNRDEIGGDDSRQRRRTSSSWGDRERPRTYKRNNFRKKSDYSSKPRTARKSWHEGRKSEERNDYKEHTTEAATVAKIIDSSLQKTTVTNVDAKQSSNEAAVAKIGGISKDTSTKKAPKIAKTTKAAYDVKPDVLAKQIDSKNITSSSSNPRITKDTSAPQKNVKEAMKPKKSTIDSTNKKKASKITKNVVNSQKTKVTSSTESTIGKNGVADAKKSTSTTSEKITITEKPKTK